MRYKTHDGVEFFVLPDNARCKIKGVHPDYLYSCPNTGYGICNTVCSPDNCMFYEEILDDSKDE